jgi:glyceraldehyde 3-phosphate dehydrogenase
LYTFPILEAFAKIENIGTAEIDLGKLAVALKSKVAMLMHLLQQLLNL